VFDDLPSVEAVLGMQVAPFGQDVRKTTYEPAMDGSGAERLLTGILRGETDRLLVAGLRPSSLTASCLIVVGRSSTQLGPSI
jgi:hypothetical protein